MLKKVLCCIEVAFKIAAHYLQPIQVPSGMALPLAATPCIVKPDADRGYVLQCFDLT
jgi:hypothetical protein